MKNKFCRLEPLFQVVWMPTNLRKVIFCIFSIGFNNSTKYLQEIHVSTSYQHWGLFISSGYESITGLQGNLSKSILDGMMRNFSKKQEELSMLNWCIWFIMNGCQFWLVQHSWRSLVLNPWQAALVKNTGKQFCNHLSQWVELEFDLTWFNCLHLESEGFILLIESNQIPLNISFIVILLTCMYHFIRKLNYKQSQVNSNSNSTHYCDRQLQHKTVWKSGGAGLVVLW